MFSEGIFDGPAKQWVVSVIAHNADRLRDVPKFKGSYNTLLIPYDFRYYYTRVGAIRSTLTKAEQDAIKSNPQAIAGPLYTNTKRSSKSQTAKDEPFQPSFTPQGKCKSDGNNCLVYAVNFATRTPVFMDKSQIVRLMKLRCHVTLE